MNYAFLFHILRFQSSKFASNACAVRIAKNLFSHCFDSPLYVRYAYNVFMQPSSSPLLTDHSPSYSVQMVRIVM